MHIIKVGEQYVASLGLWPKFVWFKENAKRFESKSDAEDAVEELLDENFYRNFDRADVTVIPCEK